MKINLWVVTDVPISDIPKCFGRIEFTLKGGTILTVFGDVINCVDGERVQYRRHKAYVTYDNCRLTHINNFNIFNDGYLIGGEVNDDSFDLSFDVDEFNRLITVSGSTIEVIFNEDLDDEDLTGSYILVNACTCT